MAKKISKKETEKLLHLAEEAVELAFAAIKRIRKGGYVLEIEEEIGDVKKRIKDYEKF